MVADFRTAAVRIAAVDTAVVVYADAALDTGAVADTGAAEDMEVAGLDTAIPAEEHKRAVEGDLAVEAEESLDMADYRSIQSPLLRSSAWPKNLVVHRSHRCLVSPSSDQSSFVQSH
jgi:hypothetical protein